MHILPLLFPSEPVLHSATAQLTPVLPNSGLDLKECSFDSFMLCWRNNKLTKNDFSSPNDLYLVLKRFIGKYFLNDLLSRPSSKASSLLGLWFELSERNDLDASFTEDFHKILHGYLSSCNFDDFMRFKHVDDFSLFELLASVNNNELKKLAWERFKSWNQYGRQKRINPHHLLLPSKDPESPTFLLSLWNSFPELYVDILKHYRRHPEQGQIESKSNPRIEKCNYRQFIEDWNSRGVLDKSIHQILIALARFTDQVQPEDLIFQSARINFRIRDRCWNKKGISLIWLWTLLPLNLEIPVAIRSYLHDVSASLWVSKVSLSADDLFPPIIFHGDIYDTVPPLFLLLITRNVRGLVQRVWNSVKGGFKKEHLQAIQLIPTTCKVNILGNTCPKPVSVAGFEQFKNVYPEIYLEMKELTSDMLDDYIDNQAVSLGNNEYPRVQTNTSTSSSSSALSSTLFLEVAESHEPTLSTFQANAQVSGILSAPSALISIENQDDSIETYEEFINSWRTRFRLLPLSESNMIYPILRRYVNQYTVDDLNIQGPSLVEGHENTLLHLWLRLFQYKKADPEYINDLKTVVNNYLKHCTVEMYFSFERFLENISQENDCMLCLVSSLPRVLLLGAGDEQNILVRWCSSEKTKNWALVSICNLLVNYIANGANDTFKEILEPVWSSDVVATADYLFLSFHNSNIVELENKPPIFLFLTQIGDDVLVNNVWNRVKKNFNHQHLAGIEQHKEYRMLVNSLSVSKNIHLFSALDRFGRYNPIYQEMLEIVKAQKANELAVNTIQTTASSSTTAPVNESSSSSSSSSVVPFDPKHSSISSKYMGGSLPVLPSRGLPAPQKRREYSQQLALRKLDSLLCDDGVLQEQRIENEHFAVRFYSDNEPITPDDKVIFIFAARKKEAFIPDTAQARIVLVMTESEYHEVSASLPAGVAVIVLDRLISETHGDFNEGLQLLTSRRIAVFLLAHYWNLSDFMMMDDNITGLKLNTEDDVFDFAQVYDLLKNAMGSAAVISMETDSHRNSKPSQLGSKLFVIDMSKIAQKFKDGSDLFGLFPPAREFRFCAEDYYMQLVVHHAGIAPEGELAYRLFSKEHAALNRDRKRHTVNACKNAQVRAQEFSLPSSYLDEVSNPWLFSCLNNAVTMLNKIIKSNRNLYEYNARLCATTDLSRAHAKVHHQQVDGLENHSYNRSGSFVDELQNKLSGCSLPPGLRYYQAEAVRAIADLDGERGFYDIAAGAGKSMIQYIISVIGFGLLHDDEFIAVVTPQVNIVKQLLERFFTYHHDQESDFSPYHIVSVSSDPGSIHLEVLLKNSTLKKNIIIFCTESFLRFSREEVYRHLFQRVRVLLFDEYQEYYRQLEQNIDHYPADQLILGLSATPPKQSILKELVYRYSLTQAIKDGYLAPIWVQSLMNNCGESGVNIQFLLEKLPLILENEYHPSPGGKTLKDLKGMVFVPSIKDCKLLAMRLEAAGIPCTAVHTGEQVNLQELAAIESNHVIIAVQMLRYAYDDPNVDYIVIAQDLSEFKEHDIQMLIQMVCRGSRPKLNKINLILTTDDNIKNMPAEILNSPMTVCPDSKFMNGRNAYNQDGLVKADRHDTRQPGCILQIAPIPLERSRQAYHRVHAVPQSSSSSSSFFASRGSQKRSSPLQQRSLCDSPESKCPRLLNTSSVSESIRDRSLGL